MSKHWIAMSGSVGCLPDHCEVYQEVEGAVEDLVSLFDLNKKQEEALRNRHFLNLRGAEDGADYASISGCECADPGIHTEEGKVDWDD